MTAEGDAMDQMEEAEGDSEENECPLAEADDRFREAHYFIERMMNEYHEPDPFRFNLNAFLQSLRNVTFALQASLGKVDGFRDWYTGSQDKMRENELLRNFAEGRNIVVKKRNLILNSSARVGFFRWRMLKLAFRVEVPTHIPSRVLVTEMAPNLDLIDEGHSAIGEQYGIERDWSAPELGDGDVLVLCDAAWLAIGEVLSDAHQFMGWHFQSPPEHGHDPQKCNVLLEMDVDPSLPEKWGW